MEICHTRPHLPMPYILYKLGHTDFMLTGSFDKAYDTSACVLSTSDLSSKTYKLHGPDACTEAVHIIPHLRTRPKRRTINIHINIDISICEEDQLDAAQ